MAHEKDDYTSFIVELIVLTYLHLTYIVLTYSHPTYITITSYNYIALKSVQDAGL